MRLKVLIIILLIWVSYFSFAQEKVGIAADPASGVYGIFINPAFSSRYPYEWHANIFAAHVFLETDYAHVSNSNLISTLTNINDLDIITKRDQLTDANNSQKLVFDTDGGRKNFGGQASILWPSLIKSRGKHEKIGAFIQTRANGSAFRIPEILGYYEISEVRNDNVTISEFGYSGLVWTELGTHYSKILQQDSYESEAVGINAKLIIPHEGGRFESLEDVIYTHQDSIYTAEGLVTSSGYNVFQRGQGFKVRWNGIGLSTDIGYHYSTSSYSYGVSLLDIGFARVSGNAKSYDIFSDTSIVFNAALVDDPNDVIAVVEEVDRQLEPQVSRMVLQGDNYNVGLPTAISLQYGKSLGNNYVVSAQLIQRFPIFKNSLKRLNSLSVVPRYQKGLFSASLPLTLYEYRDFRAGISLKYWFFFVGSEDIASILGKSNFSGTDFYFGFQLYPFGKAVKKSGVECFRFKN